MDLFRRHPGKITCDCNDKPEIEDDVTDDEEFFSAETDGSIVTPSFGDELAIPTDDPQYNTCMTECRMHLMLQQKIIYFLLLISLAML